LVLRLRIFPRSANISFTAGVIAPLASGASAPDIEESRVLNLVQPLNAGFLNGLNHGLAKMAQGFLPVVDLQDAVTELRDGLLRMRFQASDLRTGEFVRLVTLKRLRENGHLNDNPEWKNRV
jgi:hypothetical protein